MASPPIFTSLKGGMQQLPEAMVAKLSPDALQPNSPVQAVQRQDRRLGCFRWICLRSFQRGDCGHAGRGCRLLLEMTSARARRRTPGDSI